MGAIWDLPVVYVVENNLYAASTPVSRGDENEDHRGARRRLRHSRRRRSTATTCWPCTKRPRRRSARARAGEGPDAAGADDLSHHRPFPPRSVPLPARRGAARSPGKRTHRAIRQASAESANRRPDPRLDRIVAEVDEEIEAAVEAAMAAPEPKPEDTLQDLFVEP